MVRAPPGAQNKNQCKLLLIFFSMYNRYIKFVGAIPGSYLLIKFH